MAEQQANPVERDQAVRKRRLRARLGTARLIAGEVLVLAALIVAVAWVVSGWWRLRWSNDGWVVRMGRGQLFVYRGETSPYMSMPRWPDHGWSVGRLQPQADKTRFDWWAAPERFPPPFEWEVFASRDWDMRVVALTIDKRAASPTADPRVTYARCWGVALWAFPLPLLAAGGWLVFTGARARRWARGGCCVKCGYALAGLGEEAVCPECGGEKT